MIKAVLLLRRTVMVFFHVSNSASVTTDWGIQKSRKNIIREPAHTGRIPRPFYRIKGILKISERTPDKPIEYIGLRQCTVNGLPHNLKLKECSIWIQMLTIEQIFAQNV